MPRPLPRFACFGLIDCLLAHTPLSVKYDADHSGFLDLEELSKLVAVLGTTLTSEEGMISVDKNGDGKISKEEFVEWMSRPEDH